MLFCEALCWLHLMQFILSIHFYLGERSPVGRHSLALSTAPYSPPGAQQQQQQRSQSYRVPSTSERDPGLVRPRSMTPSPMDNYEVDVTRLVLWLL